MAYGIKVTLSEGRNFIGNYGKPEKYATKEAAQRDIEKYFKNTLPPVSFKALNPKIARLPEIVKYKGAKFYVGQKVKMFDYEPPLKVAAFLTSKNSPTVYDLISSDGKINRRNIMETKIKKY